MRLPSLTPTLLLTLLPSVLALTINYPTTSSTIDPTQPFVITWTSSSSDPNTISLQIHETNPTVLATDQILANGIQTSAGTFTVPASTINEFGTGFVIQALDGGNVIATSGIFALGAGSGAVSTLSNGGVTFVSVTTEVMATTTPATSTAEVPSTSAAASSGAASASTQGGAGTATETATASTSSMVLTALATGSSSRKSGSASASSSGYVTSQTLVDTSPSSITGASATSTGIAGGKLGFGGLGLVGGVMGALAVLV